MEKIPLTRPYFKKSEISSINKDIKRILTSGRLILGPYTQRFEDEFKKYIGSNHAIAVNTCTSALMICLKHIDVRKKEVIVPSNTFVTVANAVIESGGKVVFTEMDPETLCLDIDDVKKRITKNTVAVITIHMLGLIDPRIDELVKLCSEKNIFLIEDCSHSHGASINKRKAGSLAWAACFSFYPTKVMTTALGGMIVTNDDNLDKYSKSMRLFGSGDDMDQIVNMGNDWLLSEVNAAIGLQQLKKLDINVKKRNLIADKYKKLLGNISNSKFFKSPRNIVNSYYKFPVLLPDSFDLNSLIQLFKNKYNIEMSHVYVPCHLHPLYRINFGFKEGMFPITENILKRTICLPIFPQMKVSEINYVAKCFKEEIIKLN